MSTTGQRLRYSKLHKCDNPIYEGGDGWRELQAELPLCLAVVNLLAGVILLLCHVWNNKLWKALLQKSHHVSPEMPPCTSALLMCHGNT